MTKQEYTDTRILLGSQSEIAAKLGISTRSISRRETGEAPITAEAVLAITALTGQIVLWPPSELTNPDKLSTTQDKLSTPAKVTRQSVRTPLLKGGGKLL